MEYYFSNRWQGDVGARDAIPSEFVNRAVKFRRCRPARTRDNALIIAIFRGSPSREGLLLPLTLPPRAPFSLITSHERYNAPCRLADLASLSSHIVIRQCFFIRILAPFLAAHLGYTHARAA